MSNQEFSVIVKLPEDAAFAEEQILCLPVPDATNQAIVNTVPVLAHGVTFGDRIALRRGPCNQWVLEGIVHKSGYMAMTLLPDLAKFPGWDHAKITSYLGTKVHEALNAELGFEPGHQDDSVYVVAGSFVGMVTVAVALPYVEKMGPARMVELYQGIDGVDDHQWMDMGSHQRNVKHHHADYPMLAH